MSYYFLFLNYKPKHFYGIPKHSNKEYFISNTINHKEEKEKGMLVIRVASL